MKTVPISRFRRDYAEMIESALRTGGPLVVTHHGRPVAQVTPWSQPAANDGRVLTDQVEFAGSPASPVEASWQGLR